MSDASPTIQDITAGFAAQLEQNPDAVSAVAPAEPVEPVDDEPQIAETEEELTEPETETLEDRDQDNLEDPDTLEAPIQTPFGMTAEQQAVFAQADPELRDFMVVQEAQRSAKFTSDQQRLAEQRKETEALRTEAAQNRDKYAQILQGIAQQELRPPSADLYDQDPDEYGRQRAHFDQQKDARDQVNAELARVQAERTAEIERNQTAFEADVRAQLPSLIPDMADPAKAKAIDAEMKAYALSKGVPEASYPRATAQEKAILWKAMEFDKGRVGKARTRKAAPKSQRPGAARPPAGGKRKTAEAGHQAFEKTMETGDLRHVFKARLEAEGT